MTDLEKNKEEWKAHNLSETQSILIHDLCDRAFDAGVRAERERILKELNVNNSDYQRLTIINKILEGKQ